MTNVNGMFANEQKKTNGTRGLAGTAQLTSLAENIAADIMQKIDADFDTYREMLEESKTSHNAMDKLIASAYDLTTVDVEFIRELDEAVVDGMLKSQQSKRSRAKSKAMTFDNYRSMMVGALAENIIRQVTGKKKAAGARRVGVNYTDEDLQSLANDQEALRKEIRNIQSKKSIMKSKANFDEESEAWQQLLEAEKNLKAIRVGGRDSVKSDLKQLLGEVDLKDLKAADSKELLEKIKGLL